MMDGRRSGDGSGSSGCLPTKIEDTDNKLPKRLFATDRYPNARLNVYSKPKILAVVRKALGNSPEFEKIKSSPLGVLFDLPVTWCAISCKLIHALLSRQLVTEKKYEMWTVFVGQPLRFSLGEFREISGLPCGPYPKGYNPTVEPRIDVKKDVVWQRIVSGDSRRTLAELVQMLKKSKNMSNERKLALALILIVDGVLIGKHQVNKPTPKNVRMLSDVNAFMEFPWGRESFFKTIATMRPGKKGTKNYPDPVEAFCQQLQQQTIAVKGFPLILQLMAFKAIPLLMKKVPNMNNVRNFADPGSSRIAMLSTLSMNDLIEVENDPKLVVTPILPIRNHGGWGDWDDEVRDWSVLYMERLISEGHPFNKGMWPGGDDTLELVEIDDKNEVDEEEEIEYGSADVDSDHVSDIEPVKKVRKKRAGVKSVGSRRKQKRLEDYFEPAEKEEQLKQWMEDKLNEVTSIMSLKIEKQAKEIKKLKRKRKGGSVRKKMGKLLSGSKKRRRRTSEIFGTPEGGNSGSETKNVAGRNISGSFTFEEDEVDGSNEAWKDNDGQDDLVSDEQMVNDVEAGLEFPAACTQPFEDCDVVTKAVVDGERKVVSQEGVECVCKEDDKDTMELGEDKEESAADILEGGEVKEAVSKDLIEDEIGVDAVSKVVMEEAGESGVEAAEIKVVMEEVEGTIRKAIAENIGYGCFSSPCKQSLELLEDDDDSHVVVSDSSPIRDVEATPNSKVELALLKYFCGKEKRDKKLLPCVDSVEYSFFESTLRTSIERQHICANNIVIRSSFLIKLAKPTEWVNTTHMEVLMRMLKERHKAVLKAESSCFASPWLVNYLQGKYRSFSKAVNKNLISWGDRVKSFVANPGEVWFDDIETVYVPMCWEDRHWVGLAIHLRAWAVEVFDSSPNLYKARKVREFMEPVTEMLPHLIGKWCNPHESQEHGKNPFGYNVVKGLYQNRRSGDCGPVAVKFMELHANGNPDEAMSSITDKMVDDFRKQYAMDVYEEMVVPLYEKMV